MDRSVMKQLICNNAFTLDREVGHNYVTEKLLGLKLGPEFTITRQSMTKRKGKSFNTYSKSKQDLCIQYNKNAFREDTVHVGVITSSSTIVESNLDTTMMVTNEGEVLWNLRKIHSRMIRH